ncbi:YuiB family protein [Mammaliicoccus sp. Dog046]|uniref:YuiB family protein n=1 Tax=Mammaliicoccus sp. Dog046 TaxID=3034233 RepID=UPI002B25F0AA|nr:YuiB family protein [Mammaliicoccus sp. Dog046]WQK84885.1 YuiB family protein [Mammaliicoccus sp. Dog046]
MISLPQVIISMALFFVLFFGIGFILNMLLKSTWIMSVFYPFVIFAIVDKISTFTYFSNPSLAFSKLITGLTNIHTADILMLGSGWIGAIVAGFVIRNLRRSGYSMF